METRHMDIEPATYYILQGGGGHRGDLFGSPYVQRGRGFGSFLASQFRAVKRLPNHNVRHIACEALVKEVITHDNTRTHILADSRR